MFKSLLIVALTIAIASCTRTVEKDGGLIIDVKVPVTPSTNECINILKARVEMVCENNPVLRFDSLSGMLQIELPMETNQEAYRQFLFSAGEFFTYETYEFTDLYPAFIQINNWLKINQAEFSNGDTSFLTNEYPLFFLLRPSVATDGQIMKGPVCGYSSVNDTAMVNAILRKEPVARKLPNDMALIWSAKPNNDFFELIAVKKTMQYKPIGNEMIEEAKVEQGYSGRPEISMNLKEPYHKNWETMTSENIGRSLALVIDDKVYSYPIVQSSIKGGRTAISANFELSEAKMLAAILNCGKLPCRVSVSKIEYQPAR